MGRGPKLTFCQRRHGQQINEKMLDIINEQGNAKQNHNDVTPHTNQNDCIKKTRNNNC